MSAHDGGPAFPFGVRVDRYDTYMGVREEGREENEPGMSLRDYFAARFITAQFDTCDPEWLAEKAYKVADAMLKAREAKR